MLFATLVEMKAQDKDREKHVLVVRDYKISLY